MKFKNLPLVVGIYVLLSASAFAAEVEISGYATFIGSYGENNENVIYFHDVANTNNLDFDTGESNVAVQLNAQVTSKVDMTVVLSAQGGKHGAYEINTEWAYANYQFNEDWGLRIGRIKGPFYMVSDYRDVGYAYPWVRPPLEVYSTNPMSSLNGVDLVFQKTVNDINYLFELYTGSGKHKHGRLLANAYDAGAYSSFSTITSKTQLVDFVTHGMVGFNAVVGTDAFSLRAGYFDTKVDAFGMTNLVGKFGGIGLTVDWENIVIYAEYIDRDTSPQLATAFPDQKAWYTTLGYRMGNFLPYVTNAELDKGKDTSAYSMVQSSVALGLRYEVDEASAVKFEAMEVEPGLDGVGRYGLYDSPITGKGRVYTVSFDVIF